MATKKRPDFGNITKRTVKRPSSMDDFLKDDPDTDKPKPLKTPTPEKTITPRSSEFLPKTESTSQTNEHPKSKKTDQTSGGQRVASEQSLEIKENNLIDSLTFQTTVMFKPEIFEDLELLWMKLKKNAPLGKKKKFSKSLIINVILAKALKDIEISGSFDNSLVTAIMQEIEG
jgi:hypothetical protein